MLKLNSEEKFVSIRPHAEIERRENVHFKVRCVPASWPWGRFSCWLRGICEVTRQESWSTPSLVAMLL